MRLLAVFLVACCFGAAPPKPAVEAKVPDAFEPAPFEQQKIGGILGERMRVNLEGRLLHVDEKALLEGFEHRPGRQAWIGEHAGKFLDAASKTWLYTQDERLKTLMDRIARELIATQLPDGYLGTYSEDQRWTSWDVWVHKYDLLGLLSYYQATGYEPALSASKRAGDLLVKTFGDGPGQRDIIQSSTHVGMAATSVLEPMVALYRYTGDQRYLEFCRYILRAWQQPNGPKLVSSLLETGSVYKTANAKAYEMMSDLVGLLELYRVSGERADLAAAEAAWRDISTKRLYLTGTTSSKEHFKDDFVLPGEDISDVGEGCATVTWLQLNWQLLRLTAEAKYGDQIERTVYNQLLGAQDPKNGNICYFTPLNGRKNATPGINCCVSSEPRGISMIPQMTWGTAHHAFAVFLYTSGEVELDGMKWKSDTDFPLHGRVTLQLESGSGERTVLLRVPAWSDHFTAAAGGKNYAGKPGSVLSIPRVWKPGDRIEIEMNLTAHTVTGTPSYPYGVAIERGPQVLALEEAVNPNIADLQSAGPRAAVLNLRDASDRAPATWLGKQLYEVDGQVAGKPQSLFLVPFADARSYRVWMLKP